MRPYVTDVTSNIQGGVRAKIGQKTLIVGPNRIGKSSIVRAIELATTGRASDVAGRDTLALDAELWTLAPEGVEVATAAVAFSDNAPPSDWTLARGKKAKRGGRAAIFPLRQVRDAILGSAETARKFFLSVASHVTWATVLAEIPPQFHDRLAPYKSPDGAMGLLAAIEGTKKRVRDLNAEAKAHRSTAETTSRGLPPPPSAAEVAQAKAAGENATRAASVAGALARLRVVEKEANSAGERVGDCLARFDRAKGARDALPPAAAIHPVIEHAIAVGEYLAAQGSTECPICGSPTPKSKIVFQVRVAKAKAKIAETLEAMKRRQTAEAEARDAEADYRASQSDLARLEREIESLKVIIGDRSARDLTIDGSTYPTLIATAARWESVRAAEGRAIELETEATIMAQLPTLCSTAMERLLDKARENFTACVQRFMPKGMRFGVELKDGDRDVFRVGLRAEVGPDTDGPGTRNEVLRTALSGAEWATVTAALASAVAEVSAAVGPGNPVIVVPEDRDFDSNTLADVMESFSKIDAQVILTGTKPPNRSVEGWTIIDLGAASGIPWCNSCRAWISVGPCDHGVGIKPTTNGDFFGGLAS